MARYEQPAVPADVADSLRERGGTVFNLYKILANQPDLLRAWVDFAWQLRLACRTSRALRELMILRTAQLQQSAYEWHQHRIMARAAGVSETQVAELAMWPHSAAFDAREKAALQFTDAIVGGEVSDEVHAELARHFDAADRIELTVTAAFYCAVPRVLSAIAVTADGE